MTEIVEILYRVRREDNNTVYVEYFPINLGLEGVVFHGKDLLITGTIRDTVENYLPVARQEIMNVIHEKYPNSYI